MTEQDARQKWCPLVRKTHTGTTYNRPAHEKSNCIASECMLWREKDVIITKKHPEGTTWSEEKHGYCGLGGKP